MPTPARAVATARARTRTRGKVGTGRHYGYVPQGQMEATEAEPHSHCRKGQNYGNGCQ